MMAMNPGGSGQGYRPKADSDVYTALMIVAFLFVLTATLYVGFRTLELFGTILPPPGS